MTPFIEGLFAMLTSTSLFSPTLHVFLLGLTLAAYYFLSGLFDSKQALADTALAASALADSTVVASNLCTPVTALDLTLALAPAPTPENVELVVAAPVFPTPPPVFAITPRRPSLSARSDSAVNIFIRPRDLDECHQILINQGASILTDPEVVMLVDNGKIHTYALEKTLGDLVRAVKIRRELIARTSYSDLANSSLPFEHYDYSKVMGVCCENVIGYLPLPVGVAGMILDLVSILRRPVAHQKPLTSLF